MAHHFARRVKSRFMQHIFAQCLIFLFVAGCQSGQRPAPQSNQPSAELRCPTDLDRIQAIVYLDNFHEAPEKLSDRYPRPKRVSDSLLQCVSKNYASDPSLRRTLAIYFLRYDAELLRSGLIDSEARPGDLIRALWRSERIIHRFPPDESPSTTAMRDFIDGHKEWFGLDVVDILVLRENENAFHKLQDFWRTGAH